MNDRWPCSKIDCIHFGTFGIMENKDFYVGKYQSKKKAEKNFGNLISFALARIAICYSCKHFKKSDNYEYDK